MRNKKEQLKKGAAFKIGFRISTGMLDDFSRLTGDSSSLHSDESYARRTVFREKTVHGMLPVSFLCLFDFFWNLPGGCEIKRIYGSFYKPVFIDEKLLLSGEITEYNLESGEFTCEWMIEDSRRSILLTSGGIKGIYHSGGEFILNQPAKKGRVFTSSLKERSIAFQEIKVGDSAGITFRLQSSQLKKLTDIWREGVGNDYAGMFPLTQLRLHLSNMAGIMYISTIVGMSLPGRLATFIGFNCEFREQLQLGVKYLMKAEVIFKSASTSSLVEKISITTENSHQPDMVSGEAKVRVGKPSPIMPSISGLREDAVDPGLAGKVVLITGASRGIGETASKLFSIYGARVVVNYFRGKKDAERIVREIRAGGGEAFSCRADVSLRSDVDAMINKIRKRFGVPDILINNAVGGARPSEFSQLIWDDIQAELNITLKGAFNCCQAVIPGMLKSGGGKIVNMSTIFADSPPPAQARYVIAKSALIGLTRSLAVEYADKNIRINMVEPSVVATDLSAGAILHQGGEPMGRMATPIDVARAIIFLSSSHSDYTTGQKIMVTGGRPPFL